MSRLTTHIAAIFAPMAALALLLLYPLAVQAQPEVEATIAPKEILIGAPATLTLQIKHSPDVLIYWPTIGTEISIDSARMVEVLGVGNIDTIRSGGYMQQSMALQVTAWDTGFYIIPSFSFSYSTTTDSLPKGLQNYPVLLQVNTVAVDTTQAFKDIKGPIEAPFSIWEYKYWIFGGLGGILLLLIIAYLLIARRKTVIEIIAPKPVKPPHVVAMEKLQQLEAAKLWQQGDVKGYYSGLSDIMREYLERRFLFPAIELTTHEIFTNMDEGTIPPKLVEKLKELFELADLAKFAKVQPLPDEHFKAMQIAKDFIGQTLQNTAGEDA